jgi:hypothetical protein
MLCRHRRNGGLRRDSHIVSRRRGLRKAVTLSVFPSAARQFIMEAHERYATISELLGGSSDATVVNGHTFPIGQLGPEFLILRNPADHPPAHGEITMSIDGHVRRWRVHLPDGVSAQSRRTRVEACA